MTDSEELTTVQKFEQLVITVDSLSKMTRGITTELRSLQKEVNKTMKAKTPRKRAPPSSDEEPVEKKPSALQKPVKISDELCVFLGFTVGEMYSRQEVTAKINKYVKAHDLQNPENKRFILLDTCPAGEQLGTLLRTPDQPLTFFNIQRYLKPHYPPSNKDIKEAEAVAAAAAKALNEPMSVEPAVKNDEVVEDVAVVDDTEVTEVLVTKKKAPRRLVRAKA